jgi:hypothetical protein
MIFELLYGVFFLKIAWRDFRTQKIKNLDLIFTGSTLLPLYWRNWPISLTNFLVYLIFYVLSQRKLGEGDLKLSIICAFPLSSGLQLIQALTTTWILGGIFALFKPKASIAFAPFMILGTYLARLSIPQG